MNYIFAFNKDKLKPSLKMSVHRIAIKKKKAITAAAKDKKEIAALLADGKEEMARIRTEAVIRRDFEMEAYEIIELLCNILSERMNLIVSEKYCPSDLRECVSTLIWCSHRADIAELKDVRTQLIRKYGNEFEKKIMENFQKCVNDRIIVKLDPRPPNALLVNKYMSTIAEAHNVNWTPDVDLNPMEAMPAPNGHSVQPAAVSQLLQPHFNPHHSQFNPQASSCQPIPGSQDGGYGSPPFPPENGGYGLPEVQAQTAPGGSKVTCAEIEGLPAAPLSTGQPTTQAYPVHQAPYVQQQHEMPQAPPALQQVPPPAPGTSNSTSDGFDDLQARLDALKRN